MRYLLTKIVALSTVLIAACGGGSGGATTTSSTSPTPSTTTGVAATGKALVGAAIYAKCADGSSASDVTTSLGSYSLTIPPGAFPCLIQSTDAKGFKMHSVALEPGVINITPLTELLVARSLATDPGNVFAGNDFAAIRALTSLKVAAAQNDVRFALKNLVDLSAIADLIKTPFRPATSSTSGDAIDLLLDQFGAAILSKKIPLQSIASQLAEGQSSSELANQLLTTSYNAGAAFEDMNWTTPAVSFGSAVNSLATDGTVLYVTSGGQVLKSIDGGQSWSASIAKPLNILIRQSTVAGMGWGIDSNFEFKTSLLRSENSGVSWTALLDGPYSSSTFNNGPNYCDAADGRVYEYGSIAIRSSADLKTWRTEPSGTAVPCNFSTSNTGKGKAGTFTRPSQISDYHWGQFVVVRLNSGRLIAANTLRLPKEQVNSPEGATVIKSDDNGATWQALGALRNKINLPTQIDFSELHTPAMNAGTVIAPSRDGGRVFVSDLNGNNARILTIPGAENSRLGAAEISPSGIVVLAGSSGEIFTGKVSNLNNWTKQAVSYSSVSVGGQLTSALFRIKWANNQFMLVGGAMTYTSTDGMNWSLKSNSTPLNNDGTHEIAFSDGVWLVAGGYGLPGTQNPGVIESSDNGQTWSVTLPNETITGLAQCHGNTYASNPTGKIWRRTNISTKWVEISNRPLATRSTTSDYRRNVIACARGMLVQSTWVQHGSSLPGSYVSYSTDDGLTWKSTVSNFDSDRFLKYHQGRWYAHVSRSDSLAFSKKF